MSQQPDFEAVNEYLESLQDNICNDLTHNENVTFREDAWTRPEGGGGRSRVLTNGKIFEQAGVNYSLVSGNELPKAATLQRPELAGCNFKATGVSIVIHPQNPFVPTTHGNVRFFIAYPSNGDPIWWFGGGFDLTPYYGFTEDAKQWHLVAQQACSGFGENTYQKYKDWCDKYFFLPHRQETRGIGGLFFDDLNEPDFSTSFKFMQSVGNHFMKAYLPIVEKRRDHPFNDGHKKFQLYRRGRYVEFNLLYDRGTLFGLQSGGRTESILMSLPPQVRWEYNWQPKTGTAEAELYNTFLKPQDWVNYPV